MYLNDLETIISINSYTKNKHGVDRVGEKFDAWLSALGFTPTIHPRELIGEHRLYTSSKKMGSVFFFLVI